MGREQGWNDLGFGGKLLFKISAYFLNKNFSKRQDTLPFPSEIFELVRLHLLRNPHGEKKEPDVILDPPIFFYHVMLRTKVLVIGVAPLVLPRHDSWQGTGWTPFFWRETSLLSNHVVEASPLSCCRKWIS